MCDLCTSVAECENWREKLGRARTSSLLGETRSRMATAGEPRKKSLALLVFSFLLRQMIFQRSSAVATASPSSFTRETVSRFDDNSHDFFRSTIVRFSREIDGASPCVHLIIQSASPAPAEYGGQIVQKYSELGIPLMVFRYKQSKTSVTTIFDGNCRSCLKFRQIIAIFESPDAVTPRDLKIIYNGIWNPEVHVAILFTNRSIDSNGIDEIFAGFWAVDCANVVIALLNDKDATIYSHNPFVADRSEKVGERPNTTGLTYVVKPNDLLFPEKLKNLYGYEVGTSIYAHGPHTNLGSTKTILKDATGADVEIFRYVAGRLNFTARVVTGKEDAASHVVQLPCGRTVGPIGDILTDVSEYLANGQFLEIIQLYKDRLEFLYPRWRLQTVVLVRREPPLPALVRWIRPIGSKKSIRTQRLVIFLGGFFGLVTLVVYLRLLKKRSRCITLLTILELAIFQHFPKIGKLVSERIFCIAWICSAFVMSTVYQGNLVNDLTSPPVYEDIDALGDLVDRIKTLRLMIRPYERRILERHATPPREDPIGKALFEHSHVLLNFSACLDFMKESGNVACSIDESYGKYTLGQIRRYELILQKNPRARVDGLPYGYVLPPIHILDEALVAFWRTYFVRRGFPYLRVFDDTLARAEEFGLTVKWFRDDRESDFKEPDSSSEPRVLGLLHMDYTFGVLLVGHLVASLVFLGEIIFARFRLTADEK